MYKNNSKLSTILNRPSVIEENSLNSLKITVYNHLIFSDYGKSCYFISV